MHVCNLGELCRVGDHYIRCEAGEHATYNIAASYI